MTIKLNKVKTTEINNGSLLIYSISDNVSLDIRRIIYKYIGSTKQSISDTCWIIQDNILDQVINNET